MVVPVALCVQVVQDVMGLALVHVVRLAVELAMVVLDVLVALVHVEVPVEVDAKVDVHHVPVDVLDVLVVHHVIVAVVMVVEDVPVVVQVHAPAVPVDVPDVLQDVVLHALQIAQQIVTQLAVLNLLVP